MEDDRGTLYSGGSTMDYSTETTGTDASAPSVYSYNSTRDGTSLLRQSDGRVFNSQNQLYLLPADEGEYNRLDKQHLLTLIAVGGLYEPDAADMIREALAPDPNIQRAILDLGCGGGNWAMGMAQEFPHVQVIGVDLAPATTRQVITRRPLPVKLTPLFTRPPPPNCRFEFDDFTKGLEHFYESFDLVHARAVANGVNDYEAFMHEAIRCLRPGGVLMLIDGNLEIRGEDLNPHPPAFGEPGEVGTSWFARVCYEVYNAMKSNGSDIDAGMMLSTWIYRCPDLESIGTKTYPTPIGPWEKTGSTAEIQKKEIVGTLMRQNMKEYVRCTRHLLTTSGGITHDQIDRFIAETDKELDALSVHLYFLWHFAWGRKRYPTNNPQPQPSTSADMSVSQLRGNQVYFQPETAAQITQLQLQNRGAGTINDVFGPDFATRSFFSSNASVTTRGDDDDDYDDFEDDDMHIN